MSGYAPLFSSLTTGTLYGRWPDIGLWPIVLSLTDRFGVVDVTPQYLAGITGLPPQEIIDCMRRFCNPDPYSRSKDEGGARLVLIDGSRDWGWKVVNHAKYREKARLMAKSASDVGSGENRRRMSDRLTRGGTADDRRTPPHTTEDPPSDSDSDSDSDSRRITTAHPKRMRPPSPPEFLEFKATFPNRAGDQGWRKALRAAHARLAEGHTWTEMIEGARRYAAFVRASGREGGEFVKQAASFVGPDKPFLEVWEIPPSSKAGTNGATDQAALDAWQALLDGKPRDERTQAALDRIGGWGRVQGRTPFEDSRIKREFCVAWREIGPGRAEKASVTEHAGNPWVGGLHG
jgi:hypothetical protein